MFYGGRILQIEHEDPSKELLLECYKLTKAGLDIVRLIDPEPSPQYIEALVEKIRKKKFAVSIAPILEDMGDGTVRHGTFMPTNGPVSAKNK